MNSHLVTVEVGVKGGTYEGVKLDSLTLYEHGLEGLNTEAVKCGSTVKHYGVVLDNYLESIPYAFFLSVYSLSGCFDVCGYTCLYQTLHNEGLEELECHFLRKTALIKLKSGADNDNRTAGVVNSLTEKVLTEAALLTLKHI